ncbi:valine--tRNA ligase [Paraliomyxa miuraensis]|uniref:valine--tRNA ligase n=1 Tax=Paraliomyxa miuraensis TaxID=376150 RepID=UPI00225668C0|nr:valine--tRNA ligase [Paraliomyxa miuraensis]MCX4245677.1 valine--tRNA ligase [Paraliomyxa miuraensis]
MSQTHRTIDPATLPKHFDAPAAESRWDEQWQRSGLYHYDPSRPRDETFVVDTPPPTVSGSLHVGHVFSYTHTDLIVRQQRMRGKNIFYPMGWDDNGLPTERRVQNFYHVRCDASLPYEEGMTFEAASAKVRKGQPRLVSRPNFIEACNQLTREDEKAFLALWRRLGLSIDWRQEYATIDDHCRTVAQRSFLDLHQRGMLYSTEAPTLWDVDFQTAVAQAELEDRELPSTFNDVAFGVEGSDETFVISTTRPELLPACVAVATHPEDERYAHLVGKRAITPLYRVPVPIFTSELVDKDKGTGILMICTFGDQTDVQWWREQGLALRQIIGLQGRLLPVTYGTPGWESLDPDAANRFYAELQGLRPEKARERILEQLRQPEAAATGQEVPLRGQRSITHAVKFFEKGDRPLELVPTRQWFCRLLDRKQDLLRKGEEVQWHPAFMGHRYRVWTENLGLDWCISRQRYFGVSFPVWYPLSDDGRPDYDAPILAALEQLPVDPTVDVPPGYTAEQRGRPGGFMGESDVFDTWFTSSMTPQISSHWQLDSQRHAALFPADIRPQSHEIIRTWAFYTIAKAMAHEDTIPWKHVLISGWILDPDRKKMSKSKGNVIVPTELLETYTADGVRYWAASARLGVDTAFDEKVLAMGKRLVTKIFNASKFVLAQGGPVTSVTTELDRAFCHELLGVVHEASASYDEFEFAPALRATEGFFWASFTDSYLELCKVRARTEDDDAGRGSALAALRLGLSVLLRLFAPVLPYITEEVWSWLFAEETSKPSVHAAPWPSAADFEGVEAPADAGSFDLAVTALAAINRAKTGAGVGVGRGVQRLVLHGRQAELDRLGAVLSDVLAAGRVRDHELRANEALEEGVLEVGDVVFEPKPDKAAKG